MVLFETNALPTREKSAMKINTRLAFCIENNKKIFYLFFSLFAIYTLTNIVISSVLFFISHYPDSYTWTELYVNYAGGLIRRGLVGQTILYMSNIFGVQLSTILIFTPIYTLYIFLSIKFFYRNTDVTTFLLFVASPGLLFFFAQDRGMLCRKDIFFELGFLLQFILLTSKKIKFHNIFVLLIVIFIICLFIHESSIFYAILPFALFLERAHRKKQFIQYFFLLCIVAIFSLWYLYSFPGTPLQHDKILESWNKYFSLSREGALRYIGKSMSTKLAEEKSFYTASAICYFWCGFLLTAFPLFYFAKKICILKRIKQYISSSINIFFVVIGFLAPWILPFIAVDFGRHIHTGIFYLLSFSATIVALTGGIDKNSDTHISKTMWALLFVYTFCWKMWLYAENAHFLSFSFPIRIFQVGWVASLDPS